MRVTGALRLRQFWHRRGEFRRFVLAAADSQDQQVSIAEQPMVLRSAHLRATVWRIDDREFVMQAYFTDLAWGEQLFANAQTIAKTAEIVRDDSQDTDAFAALEEGAGRVCAPLGARWVVSGNPFLRVELTDLGSVEANALGPPDRCLRT